MDTFTPQTLQTTGIELSYYKGTTNRNNRIKRYIDSNGSYINGYVSYWLRASTRDRTFPEKDFGIQVDGENIDWKVLSHSSYSNVSYHVVTTFVIK